MGRRFVFITFLWQLVFLNSLNGQNAPVHFLWHKMDETGGNPSVAGVSPQTNGLYILNKKILSEILDRAPMESSAAAAITNSVEIILPMPDGTFSRFLITRSSVMAPELAAKFPEIKTFVGREIEEPRRTAHLDWSPSGFHGQILSSQEAIYIDPYAEGDAYFSYRAADAPRSVGFRCLTGEGDVVKNPVTTETVVDPGGILRTYRLAVAVTGEYTAFFGGTATNAIAAVVTTINRVNGIYEKELGVRLQLVSNNDQLIYTNAATDPYSINDASYTLIEENQTNLDSTIGNSNYDIGHVFHTGEYGLTYLRSVCRVDRKGQGCIGSHNPVGDPYYVGFVAHEMGHQFGASHTFNSTNGFCNGPRIPSTAYEPGSGSTIMAYTGLCGSDALQSAADPYFHAVSLGEILNFVRNGGGNVCPTFTETGNHSPTVTAGLDFDIPIGTPFVLTAAGSDSDGDVVSYCWEQFDLGPGAPLSDPDIGSGPLFRSFPPTYSPSRFFPRLSTVLSNVVTLDEKLPTTDREMHFRVTVRDSRGGTSFGTRHITTHSTAGPFRVLSPNSNVVWSGTQTVTWDPAGTTDVPISATSVNILLSTNGGLHFPITLVTNTPNDGSQAVTLPSLWSGAVRIKVQAANNIFFDISRTNFTLVGQRPRFSSITVSSNSVTVVWSSVPGTTYQVQYRDNGIGDPWSELPGQVVADGVTASKVDFTNLPQGRFYRILIIP